MHIVNGGGRRLHRRRFAGAIFIALHGVDEILRFLAGRLELAARASPPSPWPRRRPLRRFFPPPGCLAPVSAPLTGFRMAPEQRNVLQVRFAQGRDQGLHHIVLAFTFREP